MKSAFLPMAIASATLIVTPVLGDIVKADEVIPGIEGRVTVGEFDLGDEFGHYLVDVLDEKTAFTGFAVSSDAPNAAAFRRGWEGRHVSMEQWNEGVPVGEGADLKTTDIGSFSSLFGTAQSGVNLYFGFGDLLSESSDHDQVEPGAWKDEPEFVFFGALASHFVAFDPHGRIVDRSLSVPDTSLSISCTAGSLLFLAALRRSRR